MKEIWKDIWGFEGLYQISNLGRVKSLAKMSGASPRKDCIMKPNRFKKTQYLYVNLSKDLSQFTKTIHRLVAIAFIPNIKKKPCVNHKNGDKENNSVSNLEWVTIKENNAHAYKIGLKKVKPGIDSPNHKLTENIVNKIRNTKWNIPQYKIAELFGVTQGSISNILLGKTWF